MTSIQSLDDTIAEVERKIAEAERKIDAAWQKHTEKTKPAPSKWPKRARGANNHRENTGL